MKKEIISTPKAPAAIGPYSQAIKVGNLLFTSGQIPIDPATGELVSKDAASAARQSLENVKAILEAAGTSLDKVVKTTVLLRDINDFAEVNAVYGEYFNTEMPARSCFAVAKIPKDSICEIEVIAIVE